MKLINLLPLKETLAYPEGVRSTGDPLLDKLAKLVNAPSAIVNIMTGAIKAKNVPLFNGNETFHVTLTRDKYTILCKRGDYEVKTTSIKTAEDMYDEIESILQTGKTKRSMLVNLYTSPNHVKENISDGVTYKIYKDRNHRNFLYIDFMYNPGMGTSLAGLSGQVRAQGAKTAMEAGNQVSDMISKTYNIEDIEVVDQKNGKVQLFAVSDDFGPIDPKNVSFFHTNIKALLNKLGVVPSNVNEANSMKLTLLLQEYTET